MKRDHHFLQEFILSTDAWNTLNGGMSMTTVNVSKQTEGYMIYVKPPGVSSQSLKVEIDDNHLLIYYLLPANDVYAIRISCVIKKFTIPYDVDITKIAAYYGEEELKVLLPFNELAHGYHKEVQIFNE